MIAIAVDDEALMLAALVAAVDASSDITTVTPFSDCEEALEFAQNNPIDIAFLDINMRGMGGLALAEKILATRPNCKIVFCTGYEEYAIPAFKLHASGYLMKPISQEDVQVEIDNIKGTLHKEKLLTVKCFGNFEVYAKNEKLMLILRSLCIVLIIVSVAIAIKNFSSNHCLFINLKKAPFKTSKPTGRYGITYKKPLYLKFGTTITAIYKTSETIIFFKSLFCFFVINQVSPYQALFFLQF